MAETPEQIEAARKAQEATDEAKRKAEDDEAKRKADAEAAASAAGKGTFKVSLTEAQRKAVLDGQPLDLAEEQYTAGVRSQIGALKSRATSAERKLSEIATATEAAERKALAEQEKFKELYEREKAASEKLTAARQTDLVRAEFLLAATKANVVDPAGAFLLAKAMPIFAETIKVGEEGAVSGIDDVLKSLVEQKPYLIASGQQRVTPIGGPTNPNRGQPPVAPKDLAEAGNELERRLRQGLG